MAPGESPLGLLAFRLAGQLCALPLEKVREILPMPRLARPPGLPSLLEGFLNLGGMALPVLRLDQLFALPPLQPGLYTPLLVLRDPDPPLALLVEQVEAVLSVPGEALLPVREGHAFNDCATAEVALGGRTLHLLSPERLLLREERQRLAELQAMAQQRLGGLGAAP
jgi:purine-binding chemotaxis protein CheW